MKFHIFLTLPRMEIEMKILAFDSTAKVASVAVTEGDRALLSYSIDNGLTQSELLLPMAESALKALRLTFADVGAYAVTVGPGSFTGVRIGVSLVKGLAFAKDIPCVEVSTLLALAENLRGTDGIIVPVMDARRSQVYTAILRERTKSSQDSPRTWQSAFQSFMKGSWYMKRKYILSVTDMRLHTRRYRRWDLKIWV